MATLIRYDYHRPGKPVSTSEQWLILDRPDVKVLLTEQYDGPSLREGGTVIHQRDAPMIWFVFPERWHDIGRFHLADGSFTGWYTNLVLPVQMEGNRWIGRDLYLDLWQPVTGDPVWLDEDELNDATRSGLLDTATRKRVENERVVIDLQLSSGAWPPPIARDIDLGQARALKDTYG